MTEVRALLLTDVVDSTALSETLGDAAMAVVWTAHDRAARELLPRHRGLEIDKTDGMLLMFEQADDAVAYAQAYHAALWAMQPPLKARAGLHVGPVILRANAPDDIARGAKPLEVDGMAKPTAARIMGMARGGQTLLSPEALQATSAGREHAHSHGHWRLKGVADPVELFEIGEPPFITPPDADKAYRVVRIGERWVPLKQVPNNLPQQGTSFLGRDRELDEIKSALRSARLVTLLGMGGLGKTRLSLQVAAEMLAEFTDGVWFIDLAPLRDGSLVVAEAAQVLGVREEPGRALLQSVAQHLKDRRALLVVDNCEHVLKPAATLINAILKLAPQVAVVTSSRVPLRVHGEHTYPILPLPVPAPSDGVAALLRSTAVRLFVARAKEQRPDFELTPAEAPAVAELVARLEGIPLALELAAARLRSLTLVDINRRLKNRFKLLTGGSQLRDGRQQTLRGLVDWSYELLEPQEQTVLQRLAVFAGGFDLAAAEAVCPDDEIESDEVLDLLSSLVDKSLVMMEQRVGEGRFRMLETIREYAAEKLADADATPATAARHCQYYFDLAKRGRNGMQGPKQGEWLDRLDLEQDNLRAGMGVAQAEDSGVDPLIAVKMAVALQNFWIMRGGAGEGRAAVRALLSLAAVNGMPMARAHALYVGAALAWTQGDLDEALAMLRECLALRRGLDMKTDVAATLSTLSVTQLSSGDAAGARQSAAEAVELFRQSGYRVGEAISLLHLGLVDAQLARTDDARAHLVAALAMARQIGHPETEGEVELALGELAMDGGRADEAVVHFERSLAVCTGAGDRKGEANARWSLGRLDLRTGRPEAAEPRLREALIAFDGYDMRASWIGCLEDIALLSLHRGQTTRAAALAGAAQRLRDGAKVRRSPQEHARWRTSGGELRTQMGDAAYQAAWSEGQMWDPPEAQRRALDSAA